MPWPLQCTHERAELPVDLVLWALVPLAMYSVLLQDGMAAEAQRAEKTHQTAKLRPNMKQAQE